MLQLVPILFGALFTLNTAICLGRLCLGSVRLPRTVVFGAGAALLSLPIFLLLATRLATWPVLLILGSAIIWTQYRLGKRGILAQPEPEPFPAAERPWEKWLLRAVLTAYGVLYFVHALAPEIQPDAITYHLGLVREFVQHHGFTARVGFHEMLPQGMEALFTFGYAFGRHSAAKLIHFAFLAGTAPLMLAISHLLGVSPGVSTVAAGLYALSPVVGASGASAYTDAALVFFTLAAFYTLLRWRRGDGSILALAAGILAGFCYAVKMNGLLMVAVGFLFVAAHRRWRATLLFGAGACLMISPWMIRNYYLAGNPFAPLANDYFPNPYFHAAAERQLVQSLRTYTGLTPVEAPLELTIRGGLLQGLVGPAFLLAPLGLLALRRRPAWIVATAAVLLAIPWFVNVGTRFLMPSLPFIAMLLAMALPQRVGWALLGLHAVLCWPGVVSLYADDTAWRLKGFPLLAALRIEPEPEYLRRAVWGAGLAEFINRHTRPGSRILDLAGLPTAYVRREVIGDWQSAEGVRLSEALAVAAYHERGSFYELRASWREQPIRALRLQWASGPEAVWNIQEVALYRGEERVRSRRGWLLDADPNIWEAEFAVDGMLVSCWSSREPAKPGMYFEVEFPRPMPLSGALAIMASPAEQARIEFLGKGVDGKWRLLSARAEARAQPAVNLRREAILLMRRRGIRYIVARGGYAGHLITGKALSEHPGDWGVERVAVFENASLLAIP